MVLTRRAPYLYEDDEHPVVDPPRTARASLHALPSDRQRQPRSPRMTEDDAALVTTTRSRRRTALYSVPAPQYDDGDQEGIIRKRTTAPVKQHTPWLSSIGLGMIGMLLLIWFLGEPGATWFVTHITDPGTYGQLRGQVITGVFGGGDSQAQPSKVVSMNSNGRVLVMVVYAGDPTKAQMFLGPDLNKGNFPDPTNANVEIHTGVFDDTGNLDIKVTVLSTIFDLPFHRYSQTYILYGDGKGHFKQAAGG